MGLGNTNSESIPRPVRALMSRKVVLAACSYHHSLFLCSDGALFACGRNDSGQLGHGDTVDKKTPQAILSAPRHIVSLSCGQFHTAVSTVQGAVYVCGKNDYGQLGLESTQTVKVLSKIGTPLELDHVTQVCCGYYHTLILSGNGVTAGFGRNDYGQLGLGHTQPKVFQATLINHLRDKAVTALAAGCYHSIAVTANGMLYVFGRNNHGQLATGDLDERHTPHPVDDFVGQKIVGVSAGFYHTLVLVGNQSSTSNKNEVSTAAAVESSNQSESSDIKQLSTLLLKDLELLGAEIADNGGRELIVDCLAYVSSSDLLTVLMKNISCFLCDGINDSPESMISVDSIRLALLSLSSLMTTAWNIISGKQSISFFAMSPEDMLGFMSKLVVITSRVMQRCSFVLKDTLQKFKDVDLRSFEVPEEGLEKIQQLSSLYKNEGELPSVVDTLQSLRDAYLSVYFEMNSNENALRGEGELFSAQLCELFSKEIGVFFSHPFLLLKFVIYLRDAIQVHADYMASDRVARIKLLSSLVKVFQSSDIAKTLFEVSPALGLELFGELSGIYNSFSRKSVEKRLSAQPTIAMNVEIKKLITTLEQSLSSLLKTAVPFMFNYSGDDERMKILAQNIVVEMIQDACDLLDLVSSRGLTEENLSLLRYGTLLPSVLPTVLLYAFGFVKKGLRIPNISNSLHNLITKLEAICMWEVAAAHSKLLSEKKHEQTIPLSKKESESMLATAEVGRDRDEELSDSIMEEILYVKREQNQVSWWFRLLKLSIVLLAKITFSGYNQVWANFEVPEEFDENVVGYLHHDVWRFLLVSDRDLQDRFVYEFVVKRMESNSSIGRTGSLQDLCVKFREAEKKRDAVYRMLNQPARAAVSGTIIQALENMLFEGVCSLQFSYLKEDITQERLFRKISKFSKLIFSKRSTLLANSPLSWTETLSNLEKLVEEVCCFVTSCHSSMRQLVPLIFPRRSKFAKHWRRAILLIVCVHRWSNVMVKRPSRLRESALDFILQVTNHVTEDMTVIPSVEVSAKKLHYLYRGLVKTTAEFDAIASAISSTARFYSQTSFLSLKSDLLSSLTNILRESRLYDGLQGRSSICLSSQVYNKLRISSVTMESLIRLGLEHWLHSSSAFAMIDLQVINHLIKLQETLQIATANGRGHIQTTIPFTMCTSIITKLYEKYHMLVNSHEEKSFVSKKVSSFRERNAASKRALFSVLAYMHNLILHDADSLDVQSHRVLLSATEAYNQLLRYLQTSRNEEALTSGDENLLGNVGSEKDVSPAPNNNASSGNIVHNTSSPSITPLPSSFNLLPAIPVVSQPSNLRQTKENAKKRCQDLIVKPMEFSKSCEGVVVSGEKLLNNCKGTDFSMATWVLVTNAGAASKSSFIFGKVSHNETWPTVLLKSDGKLEIVFGHNSEFEKTLSEATIPLLTWTHIAIICEQKKLKLFFNGILDSQVSTTKGNNRAILFPLVIGTCPMQVRTRIAAVKEGFDGLVAQFKYYSRALSPIHVKIIYDNGPPELIDFSAKIIYHSLAALKCVYAKLDHAMDSLVAARRTMEICHLIFVTDTNRRNRYAALHVLRFLLLRFPITDFTLSGWRIRSNIAEKVCQVDIMESTFVPRPYNLHQRLVLYFLRIIGLNWIQYYKPIEGKFVVGEGEDTDSLTILEEIVTFAPRSCFSKSVVDKLTSDSRSSTPATSLNDRLIAQEEPRGETSYQIIAMLHLLINSSDVWFAAAKTVLADTLSSFQFPSTASTDAWKPSKLVMIDLMGVTQFLGGGFSGSYLGADVKNFFDDGAGKIIQINHTINSATVLSTSGFPPKSMRLRLSDFDHDDDIVMNNDGRLIHALLTPLLRVLDTLSPAMKLFSRDFLCHGASATSIFQQKSFLRCLRPVEAFIFVRLLTAFVAYSPQVNLTSEFPHLWNMLNEACVSSIDLDSEDKRQQRQVHNPRNCSLLTLHWFQSMKYFSLLPERILLASFPIDQDERLLIDFVGKQLGLQDDMKTIGRQISTAGLFTKTMLANVPQLLDRFDIAKFESNYLISDKSSLNRTYSMTFDAALTDADCTHAWSLAQMLRSSVIQLSRRIVHQTIGVVGYTSGPFGNEEISSLWRMFTTHDNSHVSKWVQVESLNAVLRSSLIQRALHDLVDQNESTRMKVTHFLVSAVKFAAVSMLQPAAYKARDNVLLTTDFLANLTRNLYLWLEYNVDVNEFVYLVQVTLSELLPCIAQVENPDIKQIVMQICVYFMRRFLSRAFSMDKCDMVLLDIVRSNYFHEIRTLAVEQVVKFKGHNMNNVSHFAYNVTQLVAGLELIQRRACVARHKDLVQVLSGTVSSSKSHAAGLAMVKLQASLTAVPTLLAVRSNQVDIDLCACVASIWTAENLELLKEFGVEGLTYLKNTAVVEVALSVGSVTGNSNEQPIFETIYCGSSHRLLQSGLMPDSVYQLKCRCILGAIHLTWSPLLEFRTEKGSLFTFDNLKSGADIVLSEDGMTASYTGDDSWSTLLGSRSFSSGVTSWEMIINQTSTAYIFVGVATSAADLNSFLGGCANGWGFIGEQALYHNREKVKVYGESFTSGDVIGVSLDLNMGTMSFSKNKRNLGIAFDKIYGDLYPAVAFYNTGQEISIVPSSFKTSCAHEPIPISMTRLSMDDISLLNEILLSMYTQAPISHRIATLVAEHCNQWCTTQFVRCRAISKRDVFLATESPLLKRFGLSIGERVRTYYGVAEVAGVAFNRMWFKVNPAGEVWFFTVQQIVEGRAKKYFMRCTYSPQISSSNDASADDAIATGVALPSVKSADNVYGLSFDAATVLDLLDPSKWSLELDTVLSTFLLKQAESLEIEVWKISSEQVFAQFRALQQAMGRIVLHNTLLTQKWGISGPKRKAVVARLGLLRIANQMLDMYLPFMISDHSSAAFDSNRVTVQDEFVPQVESFTNVPYHVPSYYLHRAGVPALVSGLAGSTTKSASQLFPDNSMHSAWPSVAFTWDEESRQIATAQELWQGPLHALRRLIFSPLKLTHFLEAVKKTATRPAKTEDDYDYPDNLPHVKINRIKAFRAREIADMLHLPGDDLMLATMFCQLWKELRPHNAEKLRISYTHPMDDGQSRTFKIKFEGEGVDDYGGPYREIFQQICTELQLLKPLGEVSASVLEQVAAETQLHQDANHNMASDSMTMLSTSGYFSQSATGLGATSVVVDGGASVQLSLENGLPGTGTGADGGGEGNVAGEESQLVDPMQALQQAAGRRRCFLPILLPTPNWNYDKDCTEKYKFMFHPAAQSALKQELFYFLGQMVGIAIRSRITLDLSFPSFIWKCVVGERITERDLASFDQSAYDLVEHLQVLHQHYQQDQEMLLQQVSGDADTHDHQQHHETTLTTEKDPRFDESMTLLSTSIISTSARLSNSNLTNGNANVLADGVPTSNAASAGKQLLRHMVAYDEAVNVSTLEDAHHPPSNHVGLDISAMSATVHEPSLPAISISIVLPDDPASSSHFPSQYHHHPQSSYVSQLSYETHGDDYGLDVLEDLTWSVTRSDGVTIDLVPQGRHRSVDIHELGHFLTLFVTARLEEMKLPITCFRTGLLSILPESAVSLMTWEELEHLVCGSRTIDIDRLRENTEYDDDVPPEDPHILHFWEVLEEFDESEKSAFLKFVWARPSLPPRGVEFTQKMRILSATGEDPAASQDNFLPKAHTCFFSINLPRYSSKKVRNRKESVFLYFFLNFTTCFHLYLFFSLILEMHIAMIHYIFLFRYLLFIIIIVIFCRSWQINCAMRY